MPICQDPHYPMRHWLSWILLTTTAGCLHLHSRRTNTLRECLVLDGLKRQREREFQRTELHDRCSTDLSRYIDRWHIDAFDYHVVAVFGSQSTGKSTLLNLLFDTSFGTMNENERKQTTKGIWMGRAREAPILVMDVEGTDGRERGEDQVRFRFLYFLMSMRFFLSPLLSLFPQLEGPDGSRRLCYVTSVVTC